MQDQLTLWPPEKRCSKCGETKPREKFPKRGRECRACVVKRVAAWRRANPEKYRQQFATEKHREYQRRYMEKYRPRKRRKDREYGRKNRAKLMAKHKAWRDANAEHVRAYGREKMRRRALGRDEQAYEYSTILRLDPCSYCGAATTDIDHIVPLSGAGTNQWDNLTAACGYCNRSKKDAPLLQFLLRR